MKQRNKCIVVVDDASGDADDELYRQRAPFF